jgi:hypothetical protein
MIISQRSLLGANSGFRSVKKGLLQSDIEKNFIWTGIDDQIANKDLTFFNLTYDG